MQQVHPICRQYAVSYTHLVELIYEIPEKLADILKLMKENAVDMSKQGEAYPCHNTGCLLYTSYN